MKRIIVFLSLILIILCSCGEEPSGAAARGEYPLMDVPELTLTAEWADGTLAEIGGRAGSWRGVKLQAAHPASEMSYSKMPKLALRQSSALKLSFSQAPDKISAEAYERRRGEGEMTAVPVEVDQLGNLQILDGEYIYVVTAVWENGDSMSYAFSASHRESSDWQDTEVHLFNTEGPPVTTADPEETQVPDTDRETEWTMMPATEYSARVFATALDCMIPELSRQTVPDMGERVYHREVFTMYEELKRYLENCDKSSEADRLAILNVYDEDFFCSERVLMLFFLPASQVRGHEIEVDGIKTRGTSLRVEICHARGGEMAADGTPENRFVAIEMSWDIFRRYCFIEPIIFGLEELYYKDRDTVTALPTLNLIHGGSTGIYVGGKGKWSYKGKDGEWENVIDASVSVTGVAVTNEKFDTVGAELTVSGKVQGIPVELYFDHAPDDVYMHIYRIDRATGIVVGGDVYGEFDAEQMLLYVSPDEDALYELVASWYSEEYRGEGRYFFTVAEYKGG